MKIKIDGVPIGRKVDLKAFTDYDHLSSVVDELFRGLLAAQGEISNSEKEKMEKMKMITGLLDGRGDYTLVYEDSEGDRMLIGDAPWQAVLSINLVK